MRHTIRARFKKFFKTSPLVFNLLVGVLYLYIKLCYMTIRWHFIYPEGYNKDDIKQEQGVLFAIWHEQLVYSIKIFGEYKPIKALASPHTDGRIITRLVNLFGYDIISGSTNKDATKALRLILQNLKGGVNVVITPDGPRGPTRRVNSSITRIAAKYGYKLIAASLTDDSCMRLRSWDKMMIPRPFARVDIRLSKPLELSGKVETDELLLAASLNGAVM